MIRKEAWYEEIKKSPDALRSLRELKERVQRRDEDAVVPYLKALNNSDKLISPLPELSWLNEKAEAVQKQVIDRFEETLSLGSLIGSGPYSRNREDLRTIFVNLERSIRVTSNLSQGGSLPLPEWTIQAVSDLLEYSKIIPDLVSRLQEAIDEAIRIRDSDPKAIEFKDQFEEEVEWLKEHLKELDRIDIVIKKLGEIDSNRDVVTDSDEEEEEDFEHEFDPDSASDNLFQAGSFSEMVGTEINLALNFLITHGYPEHDVPSESYIEKDFQELTNYVDEAAAILSRTNREDVDKVTEEFKDSGGGKL